MKIDKPTIQDALKGIVECFESGKIPEAISYSVFPVADIPSAKWSFLNRLIMYLSGTFDGRGFYQWKQVNRRVKKGAKAFYILVPRFKKHESEDTETDEEEVLVGFMLRPVFRVEDTEGEPMAYQNIELPEFNLIEKAHEWGISVKAIPGNYRFYGYFSKTNNEIGLATEEESIFFHELAHAAHSRIETDFNNIQPWKKEIVAELSAAVLCRLVGKTSIYIGNNYQYISHYAKEADLSPIKACLSVMNDVENILGLILENKIIENQKPKAIETTLQTQLKVPGKISDGNQEIVA